MEEERLQGLEGENEQEVAVPASEQEIDAPEAPEASEVQELPEQEQDGARDENAQFAAARRRAEAEYSRKLAAQEDALVARIYGGQTNPYTGKPIASKADYEELEAQAAREEQEQQLAAAGLDRSVIEQIVEQNPVVQQARTVLLQAQQAEGQRALEAQVAEIGKLDASVTSMADVVAKPTFAQFDALVRRGYSIADAYRLANFDTLAQKRSAAAKQEALNEARGKSHLTATRGSAGEDVVVPADTFAVYHKMFPDWSDKQIMDDYKKHA